MAIRPGFKLYPSNKQRMRNKDLARFLQGLCLNYAKIEQAEERFCWVINYM